MPLEIHSHWLCREVLGFVKHTIALDLPESTLCLLGDHPLLAGDLLSSPSGEDTSRIAGEDHYLPASAVQLPGKFLLLLTRRPHLYLPVESPPWPKSLPLNLEEEDDPCPDL
ncbi:hypothetical protein Dimus_007782, partial [Dionaea muscipula]